MFFGLFAHPATRAVCRHCGGDAGYMDEAEMCFRCGYICEDCFLADDYPCEPRTVTVVIPPRKRRTPSDYCGA